MPTKNKKAVLGSVAKGRNFGREEGPLKNPSKIRVMQQTRFLSGNEALAIGAYEAGLHVSAAYPGTPSTEITQYLSLYKDVDAQWSVNEKVAFEVALAAAVGGSRSMYISKHVGVNVAMDPLMTSAYIGVNGGFVIVSADDPGLPSSQNEQDNRLFARVAKIPMLEPSSPAEAYAMAKEAFALSEKFDIPVMVRMTTRVCHTKENVKIGERKAVAVKSFTPNPSKYVMVPANALRRHIDLEDRVKKLKAFAEKSKLNAVEMGDKKIGFITSGVCYQYVKEAYPEASVLKLGMSYPFPEDLVRSFAKRVKKLVVVEELEPFIENNVKMLGLKFVTKHDSFRIGELNSEYIPAIVKGEAKQEVKIPSRRPQLCAGCPHRLVFGVLRNAGAVVAGDIGCYTLGSLPPFESLHTCLCMGSGVTFFEGLGRSIKDRPIVGVIGDSTFVHSGITGLINAVYNKAKGVIVILDNATTAMTGGQPHPATGQTLRQEETKRLSLEKLCEVCGADTVDVIDPIQVKEFEALLKQRMADGKLSVIIARRPCKLI